MFHECYRLHGNTQAGRRTGATAGRTTFFLIYAINFHPARSRDTSQLLLSFPFARLFSRNPFAAPFLRVPEVGCFLFRRRKPRIRTFIRDRKDDANELNNNRAVTPKGNTILSRSIIVLLIIHGTFRFRITLGMYTWKPVDLDAPCYAHYA